MFKISTEELLRCECIFHARNIPIPEKKELQKYLAKKCDSKIYKKNIFKNLPNPFSEMKKIEEMTLFRLVSNRYNAQELIDHIQSKKGILPGIYGLAIAYMQLPLLFPTLYFGDAILGLDHKENLTQNTQGTPMIPQLRGSHPNNTVYDWTPWDTFQSKQKNIYIFYFK